MMNIKYEYRVLENRSINFFGYPHDDPLIILIYNILNKIGVPMITLTKVWQFDDLEIIEDSDYGIFKIKKNLWGDISIIALENKNLIAIIDNLLMKDKNFTLLL